MLGGWLPHTYYCVYFIHNIKRRMCSMRQWQWRRAAVAVAIHTLKYARFKKALFTLRFSVCTFSFLCLSTQGNAICSVYMEEHTRAYGFLCVVEFDSVEN